MTTNTRTKETSEVLSRLILRQHEKHSAAYRAKFLEAVAVCSASLLSHHKDFIAMSLAEQLEAPVFVPFMFDDTNLKDQLIKHKLPVMACASFERDPEAFNRAHVMASVWQDVGLAELHLSAQISDAQALFVKAARALLETSETNPSDVFIAAVSGRKGNAGGLSIVSDTFIDLSVALLKQVADLEKLVGGPRFQGLATPIRAPSLQRLPRQGQRCCQGARRARCHAMECIITVRASIASH